MFVSQGAFKVAITDHAYKRYLERWDFRWRLAAMAEHAFQRGRNLTPREYQRFFNSSLTKDHDLSNYYRVYKDFVFVFKHGKKAYVLITLFPL